MTSYHMIIKIYINNNNNKGGANCGIQKKCDYKAKFKAKIFNTPMLKKT